MACTQDRACLETYLDGELAADQEEALQQHICACPRCAGEIASIVRLRRAMKPGASRFTPSEQFRQKIQAQVSAKPRLRMNWLWPVAAAMVAVMVVAVVWTQQSALRSQTFREVADLHISDLASANPYDVVSSDRHTVKPWFQGRIPFAFNLPEFAGTEFALLGGRMVYLHQQPAAQVVVGAGQHKISVLILQANSATGASLPFSDGIAVRDSFNVETWQKNGLRFFVIGDAEKTAIQSLSWKLQAANN